MGLHWKFEKKKAGDWSKLMENGMFANENIGLMEFNWTYDGIKLETHQWWYDGIDTTNQSYPMWLCPKLGAHMTIIHKESGYNILHWWITPLNLTMNDRVWTYIIRFDIVLRTIDYIYMYNRIGKWRNKVEDLKHYAGQASGQVAGYLWNQPFRLPCWINGGQPCFMMAIIPINQLVQHYLVGGWPTTLTNIS